LIGNSPDKNAHSYMKGTESSHLTNAGIPKKKKKKKKVKAAGAMMLKGFGLGMKQKVDEYKKQLISNVDALS
jgi:hypothetical protein